MPLSAIHRFQEVASAEIIEGYGLTEASPVTHLNPLRGKRKKGSIGLPYPDTDAKVVDLEDGVTPLCAGRTRRALRRGPGHAGYWNRPEETAPPVTAGCTPATWP